MFTLQKRRNIKIVCSIMRMCGIIGIIILYKVYRKLGI